MNSISRPKWKTFVFILVLLGISSGIFIMYICGGTLCSFTAAKYTENSPLFLSGYDAYLRSMLPSNNFSKEIIFKNYDINVEREDVFVFLHMQKTGGTSFGKHLVKHLQVGKPCHCMRGVKRCECYTKKNYLWLLSRYSTGWICGLHADWTELQPCVEDAMNRKEGVTRKRSYHYITILRDPLKRFYSEWKHVQRGATWKAARLVCDGRQATLKEVPFCYEGEDWTGVTLDQFMDCPHNLAVNRMTRMLANLSKVNCYNTSTMSVEKRNSIILQSAKQNLIGLDFVGIMEFQRYTQLLFEKTFGLKFSEKFTVSNKSKSGPFILTDLQREKMLKLNTLDIELYQYAKDLFLQRVRQLKDDLNDDSPLQPDNSDDTEDDYENTDDGDDDDDDDDEYKES